MALPREVADALGQLDAAHDERFAPWRNQWLTIRAHLLSQDAEIARVLAAATLHRDGRLRALEHMAASESRLAAADALLRDVDGWDGLGGSMPDRLFERIDAYLQGDGDEA